jgi:hypothetical protein
VPGSNSLNRILNGFIVNHALRRNRVTLSAAVRPSTIASTWPPKLPAPRAFGRRQLHMFHLAFSSGEEHASAAFHSIARARNHADLSRAGLQLKRRLSRSPDVRAPGLLFWRPSSAALSESYSDVIIRARADGGSTADPGGPGAHYLDSAIRRPLQFPGNAKEGDLTSA